MASQAKGLLSEECRDAINRIASYELHACYYIEDSEAPTFHTFFQDQADVKREHAKQFIKYLRKYKCTICLPVIKRPDLDNWGTGKQALLSAVQLENELNELLQDLKASASRNRETNLLRFMKKFLDEQTRNLSYLEYQLNYQMDLEKSTQSEGQPENVAGPSGTAGQETESAGNSPSPPAQKVPKSAP
ncbi:soma ferritin-like [Ovis canadensis]|uniref:soma ferritin-like n=1 Tax=Ovis canadensis TaxID=37174 RepID=UPI0037533F10